MAGRAAGAGASASAKKIKTYLSPRDPSGTPIDPTPGVDNIDVITKGNARFTLIRLTDGTSNIVGVAEQYGICGPYGGSPDLLNRKVWAYNLTWD